MTTIEEPHNDLVLLTEAQEKVLSYIEDCMDNGPPPTRAEIAVHMGWKSPNAADECLRALERKERIQRIPGAKRGIRLVRP